MGQRWREKQSEVSGRERGGKIKEIQRAADTKIEIEREIDGDEQTKQNTFKNGMGPNNLQVARIDTTKSDNRN